MTRWMPIFAALSGIFIAMPNLAHAGFKVRVDNKANPDPIASWATNADLEVFVAFRPGHTYVSIDQRYIPNPEQVSSTHDTPRISSSNWSSNTLSWMGIGLSGGQQNNVGSDMFGIDQVQILNDAGTVIQTFGGDNQMAWCISTDFGDGNSTQCNNQPAFINWYFYPNGDVIA